jgi:hypothetical protein
MDVHEAVASLRSDFQTLQQLRREAVRRTEIFFHDFPGLGGSDAGVTRQTVEYQIDLSEDESDSEVPPPRQMMFKIGPIIDIKPNGRGKRRAKEPEPEPEPVLPFPIVKPVVLDRGCQSRRPKLVFSRTRSEDVGGAVLLAGAALMTAETQTKTSRCRHEITQTEAVLPSYEHVCMSFLEALLSDAPVFTSQGPRPEQVEELLLSFLDQLLRDARSAGGDTEPEPAGFRLAKRPKRRDVSVQEDARRDDATTQTYVALRTIERPHPTVDFSPQRAIPLELTRPLAFEKMPNADPRRWFEGDTFQFPPSLRMESHVMPPVLRDEATAPTESLYVDRETEPHLPRADLRIDRLAHEAVSQKPFERPDDRRLPHEPPAPSQPILPPLPEIDPRPRRRPPPPPSPPRRELQESQLPALVSLEAPSLSDLKELSDLNLESLAVGFFDEEEDDGYAESGTGDSSVDDRRISDVLGSSVGSYSAGKRAYSHALSSGELLSDGTMSSEGFSLLNS